VDMLDRIDASSMFATKTNLDPWNYKISQGEIEEKEVTIEEEMPTRKWVKEQKELEKDILPILIINPEGHKRPFHYHDNISPGKK